MGELIYRYPPLFEGTLLKRYKRFFADVELANGEVVTAHCPNTGPMTGVCTLGSPVLLSKSDDPKRKLAYTWELIQAPERPMSGLPTWVGVNTALPNKVTKLALENRQIPELVGYTAVRSEVPYGQEKSRVDFVLDGGDRPVYVEVKNTTWVQPSPKSSSLIALFPDTVTTRGQKHIRELMGLLGEAEAVMLYFINRGDCTSFAPGDSADPKYGELLRQSVAQGLRVLPCRFEVTPEGVSYLGLADLDW